MKWVRTGLFAAVIALLLIPSFIFSPVLLSADAASSDHGAFQPYIARTELLNRGSIYLASVNRNTGADCMSEKGPQLIAPPDNYLVGMDPVTGQNAPIELAWNQLCSATSYELQISKDAGFTKLITPAVNEKPANLSDKDTILLDIGSINTSNPSAHLARGALPKSAAFYRWRVRACKLSEEKIERSPWSDSRSFTVKEGFSCMPCNYMVQLTSPTHGATSYYTDNMTFAWVPLKEANKYQIDIATDPEFKHIFMTANTTTADFTYRGKLDYSTDYFWRVKPFVISGSGYPCWSVTFQFTTAQSPPPPPSPQPASADYTWIWIFLVISALLVVLIVVLISVRRKARRLNQKDY